MFLLVFGAIIVGVLLVYFVPKFEPIFARMAELWGSEDRLARRSVATRA